MNSPILSSSSIVGTKVYNNNGDSLGDIKDLMIDPSDGHVNYAVLSFGGFLGIGDKYFAVPLEAFRIDQSNERFVLDVKKERLEKAPGFDKDNWPNTADNTFTNQVYDFYGVERRRFNEPVASVH